MSWHVEDWVWEAYVDGRLDPAAEASVDTHVQGCVECRAAARGHAPSGTAAETWAGVHRTIAVPRAPAPLRLLHRLGVRGDDLVVVSAADSLLLPWAVAVGAAVACALVVGFAGLGPVNQDAVFLALSPLVPVLAIVAAYDALDPLRELEAPTPYSKLRLALLRAAASLAVAVPATAAVGLVVPGLEDLAWVWLAPSFGLTLGLLVLLTWWEARMAGAMVASLWVGTVLVVRIGGAVDALTAPEVQGVFAAAGIVLGAALVLRTSTLRLQGGDL